MKSLAQQSVSAKKLASKDFLLCFLHPSSNFNFINSTNNFSTFTTLIVKKTFRKHLHLQVAISNNFSHSAKNLLIFCLTNSLYFSFLKPSFKFLIFIVKLFYNLKDSFPRNKWNWSMIPNYI